MYIVEEDVREFIRRLPDLSIEPPTAHLLMLIIRSRYSKDITGIKVKDIVTERKIIRNTSEFTNEWREKYFHKVYNLAVLQASGRYIVKDVVMPHKVMGILATITPRNVGRSAVDVIKYTGDRLLDNHGALNRLDLEFFSSLHRNKIPNSGGNKFLTVDIDDPEVYTSVYDFLTPFDKWMITRTSRGYHIILDLKKEEMGRDFYHPKTGVWPKILEKHGNEKVELQRDAQEPVPGTFYYNPKREDNYVEIIE